MTTKLIETKSRKAHQLLEVTRLYAGGAIVEREGQPAKRLSERQAKRIDSLLRKTTSFRSWPCVAGRTFVPLSPAERRTQIAGDKRNAEARKRRALGMVESHGWTGRWQRR